MTNIELQAIRRSLFLDVSEAVEHIKTLDDRSLSVRSWQHWEKGDRPIPADVHVEMQTLANILRDMQNDGNDYKYHRTLEEHKAATGGDNVVVWRMTQAVAAGQIIDDLD